jgi:predicted metal-dependent hydrolase
LSELEKHKIQYGKTEIEFRLYYLDRKTLGIYVNPDMSVVVKAPKDAELKRVYKRVEHRAPWILRQQKFFKDFHPLTPPRKYNSGETHLYLGKQYRLKIIENEKEDVKLIRGYIEVYTSNRENNTKVKFNLESWYRSHAVIKLEQYVNESIQLFRKYKIAEPEIVFRTMRKRWGSCTKNGKLILNPELIKAPKMCIEYVIIHELCHLIHPNHSKKFIELKTQIMPDWEKWKDRLEMVMA